MGVKLHIDLETLQLIAGPGQRSGAAALRFKRGDSAQLQVVFLENGITPATIGNPNTLGIQIGLKPRNQFDRSYLAHSADWSMPSEGDDTPTYECALSFNTLQLNSALNVGSVSVEELPEITLMGEITWREGAGESTSTRTFLVVIENDVNRGMEGVPVSAEPPYPSPENLVTLDQLAPYAQTEDLRPIELANQPASEAAQKVTITGSPYVSEDTEISLTVGWSGNSVTVTTILLAGDYPPEDNITQTFAVLINDNAAFSPVFYATSSGSDLIVRWNSAKPSNFSMSSDYGAPAVACNTNGVPATVPSSLGQSAIVSGDEWVAVSINPILWRKRTTGNVTTVGQNLAQVADSNEIRFLRVNANNTVSAITASGFLLAVSGGNWNGTVFSAPQSFTTNITVGGTATLNNVSLGTAAIASIRSSLNLLSIASAASTASVRTALASEVNSFGGLVTFSGNIGNASGGNLTLTGNLINAPDTRSGAGAISVATSATALTTTGVGQALTLANGVNGQIKTIAHVSRGGGTGTAVLTPTTANGFTTITFTAVGDSVALQYFTTGGWCIIGSRGVTIS